MAGKLECRPHQTYIELDRSWCPPAFISSLYDTGGPLGTTNTDVILGAVAMGLLYGSGPWEITATESNSNS